MNLNILLAEDSADSCTITVAYLEDTPYRVDIAETALPLGQDKPVVESRDRGETKVARPRRIVLVEDDDDLRACFRSVSRVPRR